MLERLQTYSTKGTTFYGLEVYQTGDRVHFYFLEVALVKGTLTITQSCVLDTLTLLPTVAKPSIPLHLVYNTAGVITKLSAPEFTLTNRAAIEQQFPGLNFENFYVQIAPLRDHKALSIVKKNEVDDVLTRLKNMKCTVVGISLGPCSLHALLNHIKEKTLYTNTEKIVWDNATLSITKTEEHSVKKYYANGLVINSAALLPFSGIVTFLSGHRDTYSNFDALVIALKNEHKNQRTFTLLLRASLILVLTVLLLNFISFTYYFEKVTALKKSAVLEPSHKKNLTLVRNRVQEKEKKADALLSASNSRTTFYVDRVAATIPHSILLTEWHYQPLEKPVQASRAIALQQNKIVLLGTCTSSEDFSVWITHLEELAWVKSVETLDYDYKNNHSSAFKLQIRVTPL